MKRLEFIKGFVALAILASAYNVHFDLISIPELHKVHTGLSLLCVLLFLAGLYHDRLGQRILRSTEKDGERFSMSPQASREILFREGLIGFLFAIPVIPTLLRFPGEPHLGLSLLLFPLHGLVRAYRSRSPKRLEIVIGGERMAYTLRSTRPFRFEELRRVLIKYEHLYFVLKNEKVETLPLDHFPQDDGKALRLLGERLIEHGIKGGEAVQELGGSANSKE